MMTYPDSVRFLYSLGNEVKSAKLGLERMQLLVGALGRPDRAMKLIHVAGTNGKGSASAMIEAGLRAAGLRTGLYTSPHLVEPTERIKISGQPVSAEQFVASFETVHSEVERLLREGLLDMHPTYFETVTAMALVLFREAKVDWAVLEVGLGGRLDATNVVTPGLSVITPVDFDHEAYLGRSLAAIAGEKAGILKPGVPAVFARQRREAEETLVERAAEAGAPVCHTRDWECTDIALTPAGCSFLAKRKERIAIDCPLAGRHQVENALTAVAALDAAGIPADAIRAGIATVQWPGRLERVSEHPAIILDGAHNPAGARALADYIRAFYAATRVWMIYGAMRDKAVAEVTAILFPLAARVILTAPRQTRAVRPEVMIGMIDHPGARLAPDLASALELLHEASADDVVFITGSLFLVGEARAMLVK